MKVQLRKSQLHDQSLILPQGVRSDVFEQVLRDMNVEQDVLDRMLIVVGFAFIVPLGVFFTRVGNEHTFEIYLNECLLENPERIGRVVAHELKHLATEISKPHTGRPNRSKGIKSLKWEEVNCERAGKRFSSSSFFVFD